MSLESQIAEIKQLVCGIEEQLQELLKVQSASSDDVRPLNLPPRRDADRRQEMHARKAARGARLNSIRR